MSPTENPEGDRREFLTGRALRNQIERAGQNIADAELGEEPLRPEPSSRDTLRLATKAMACEFAVVMNPGSTAQIDHASAALEKIHELESQLTVYREESELSAINREAGETPKQVERNLFELLVEAQRISQSTTGAFDPTAGPLLSLWRVCKEEKRVPNQAEVESALSSCGIEQIRLNDAEQTVQFTRAGLSLNLGGIGKGYALDQAGKYLHERGFENWLFHGGNSSILAAGEHTGQQGWPVGVRNPLFPTERIATLLLKETAFSASGSGVQFYRHGGQRYGHILDPRTGWPVEGMLSVVVLAPTAALADALSTAFFVLGVEKACEYCDNYPEVRALLIPPPRRGRRLQMINCGISSEVLYPTVGADVDLIDDPTL